MWLNISYHNHETLLSSRELKVSTFTHCHHHLPKPVSTPMLFPSQSRLSYPSPARCCFHVSHLGHCSDTLCLNSPPHPYGPICVNSTASLLKTSAGFLELSLNPLSPFPWNSLLINLLPLQQTLQSQIIQFSQNLSGLLIPFCTQLSDHSP